jgi:hypothetical protein
MKKFLSDWGGNEGWYLQGDLRKLQNNRVLFNITEVDLQGRKKHPQAFQLLIRGITTLTCHVLR